MNNRMRIAGQYVMLIRNGDILLQRKPELVFFGTVKAPSRSQLGKELWVVGL